MHNRDCRAERIGRARLAWTHHCQPRGFTLVELLVVLAVLGVLVSILLPSLTGARKQARRVQCLTQVREIYNAHAVYLMQERLFPPLNNEEKDGTWQYNYLIYDGEDYVHNFGPLVKHSYIPEVKQLFCPVQEDPYHALSTTENPWPTVEEFDTRAAYARRYDLTEKSFTKLHGSKAVFADVLHLPKVIRSGHKTGVNAVFGDGHGMWVVDPGILTDNDLSHPFDLLDNPIMEEIWKAVDKGR